MSNDDKRGKAMQRFEDCLSIRDPNSSSVVAPLTAGVPPQEQEKAMDTRVEPLTAGVDGQELPQSGNEVSPSPFQEHRCIECGWRIAGPGLCGECSCEDDGGIW